MIKKVNDINLVPEDLQELLLPEKGEYIPLGSNIYEIFPFPIEQYLKLLSFMGKYFTAYNKTFAEKEKLSNSEFFGALAQSLIDNTILQEFFKLFPDIECEVDVITFQQLQYLLGIIYKLNFLAKKKLSHNLQTNTAIHKMQEMMGLTFLNQMTS